jgi:N-acylneuraminate cytidylyltransferase
MALIPARAGSKGVRNKNLQTISNKTLIELAIEVAKQTNKFDQIFVSSDSPEILQTASRLEVSTLQRPDYLSGDDARASDVVKHAISVNSETLTQDDVIVYLQPTSPFSRSDTIRKVIDHCLKFDEPTFTATENQIPVSKIFSIGGHGRATPFLSTVSPTTNRQESPLTYHATGACYAFKLRHFMSTGDIPVLGAYAYIVDVLESFDIDSELDLRIARLLASEGTN